MQAADLEQAGLLATLGMKVLEATGDRVALSLHVQPSHHQTHGIVHGGVHCSLVETAASVGASLWWGERGLVVGVNNQTDFLRAVSDGEITAVGTPLHRGRSQQLWEVRITDEQERLIARGQVRLQNLDR